MSGDSKFSFVHLPKKLCPVFSEKDVQENLMKWGLRGHLKVNYYNFNQDLKLYDKQAFVDCFFQDVSVYTTLETFSAVNTWVKIGVPADSVKYSVVPCSETSMKFFDKLTDENNGIVRCGYLSECMDEFVDDMILQNNLCQMLMLEEHSAYNLYTPCEKQQFIFQLFKHITLGGAYCQRSFYLQPYLDLTKSLYKDLVAVEKNETTNEIRVSSVVMTVVAYCGERPIAPANPDHVQNFMYLIVDRRKRQVSVFQHQFGGCSV